MATGNPILTDGAFRRATGSVGAQQGTMTAAGAYFKTLVLLVIALIAAGFGWQQVSKAIETGSSGFIWIGIAAIAGLVIGFATIFLPRFAFVLAPLYAVAEGVFIGGVSALYNFSYPGIVLQAVGATACVFAVMLALYSTNIIHVTQKYVMVIAAATIGVLLFYVITFVLGLFGVNMSAVLGSGPLGIAIAVIIALVAAFNLPIDFEFMKRGEAAKAPKSLEWLGAFGLIVDLIWVYLSVLRLLSLLRGR